MTAPGWPGLGFDPAPGDPVGATALASRLGDAARRLRETHDQLVATRDQHGGWSGEAAQSFAEQLSVLPRYLDAADVSLRRSGEVLHEWSDRLGGFQKRGREIEAEAVRLRGEIGAAETVEGAARANPDLGLRGQLFPPEQLPEVDRRLKAAEARLNDAVSTIARLQGSLSDLLRQGESLLATHGTEARMTADRLRRADDGLAPPEPGWFEQALDWVGDHLGEIGDFAGIVSAIASTAALVFPPCAAFAAPIALAAGGVALLAHGAEIVVEDKGTDFSSWLGLGADVVGLLPGGKLAAGALDGALTSFRTVEGLTPAVRAAGEGVAKLGFPEFVAAAKQAGGTATWAAEHVTPAINRVLPYLPYAGGGVADVSTVAGGIDGLLFTLAPQIPTANSLVSGDDNQVAKDAAAVWAIRKPSLDGEFSRLLEVARAAA